MLRWITFWAGTCGASATTGLGMIGEVEPGARNACLLVTALSATVLVSLFDAYETDAPRRAEGSED